MAPDSPRASRRLFRGLTDAQLRTLRRLLAAALAASPDLADGEALQLLALADADAARRASRRPPVSVPDAPSQPPPPPGEFVARLSSAVASVRPHVTSTTKWHAAGSVLAAALGLPASAVYVTSVGGLSRNIAVRLAQSRRAREATVVAVIWAPGAEPTRQALAAASRACVEIPRLTLVFTTEAGSVDLAAIVTPPSLPAPPVLTLAYPHAPVILADAAHPSRGDG
jgi:hypothetical protein